MRGYPLPRIIQSQLTRYPNRDPRRVIRDTLSIVENDIRFRAVRVFTTYNSLLALAYQEEGIVDGVATIQSIPLFLELGASDRTMISFMELGVSRATAVELARRVRKRDMDPGEALRWLQNCIPEELRVSATMTKEVARLQARRATEV
jgi:hypothetical protein